MKLPGLDSTNLSILSSLHQFSRRLQPEQGHLLQGAVLHQLPRPHLDPVLDHRAGRLPGLQVHRELQAAEAQLRLRREAVHGVRERPAAHHVPGEEGRVHGDRGGRVPQHDRGEVRLHHGQRLRRLNGPGRKNSPALVTVVTIVVLLYLKSGTRSTSYLNGHYTGSITNTERKEKKKKTTLPSQALFF